MDKTFNTEDVIVVAEAILDNYMRYNSDDADDCRYCGSVWDHTQDCIVLKAKDLLVGSGKEDEYRDVQAFIRRY